MKGLFSILFLSAYCLGKIEETAKKDFLKGGLEVRLEATEVAAQDSELGGSANATSNDAKNNVTETTTESAAEEKSDTFMYGVYIDIAIVVFILAFILYQVLKKDPNQKGQAYSKAP